MHLIIYRVPSMKVSYALQIDCQDHKNVTHDLFDLVEQCMFSVFQWKTAQENSPLHEKV